MDRKLTNRDALTLMAPVEMADRLRKGGFCGARQGRGWLAQQASERAGTAREGAVLPGDICPFAGKVHSGAMTAEDACGVCILDWLWQPEENSRGKK